MSSFRRRLALAAAGSAVVAGAVLGVYRLTDAADATSAGEAVTVYDVRDARQVAGTADDVFAGEVVNRTGQRDIDGILSDLYQVQVERSFKGSLQGTVTVSSEQGATSLAPGDSYVFATGQVPGQRGWGTSVQPLTLSTRS
ncbi:hypothetical protein [Streptomyces sp. NPDC003006]